MKNVSALLIILALSCNASAASTPTFDDLSDADFDSISKDFSGMFVHTSATPPTSLGKIFGVEAAVIAGAAEIPGVESISKRFDPTLDIPYAPFAMLYGAVSVPFGITIETNILPSTDVSGLDLSHYGAALKWSLTDNLFSGLPFDLAVKTFYSKSEIGFSQTVANGGPSINVDVGFENKMSGADLVFGLDFIVVQPYVGAGYVRSSSDLRGVAAADPSYSLFVDNVSESKHTSVSSARLIAGCQFNLAMLKTSVEYNNVFGNNRLAVKLGLAF
ncbi:MAG: hypothetical protein IT287_01015 [Bdellovibrionaceae bacterium]|nr:hypothetical protein [Pseudobdellovibrionaceae bacterium]